MGLPADAFYGGFIAGVAQRARAGQLLVEDLYGPQHMLARFPHWRGILAHNGGYWPALVGRLGDHYFARFYGPDLFWEEDANGRYRFELGEENDGNVMGAKGSIMIDGMFRDHPEWGRNPLTASPFPVWVEALKRLAREHSGKSHPRVVIVDDASVGAEPIRVGDEEITPPYPSPPPAMAIIREVSETLGVDWFSLVDERGRLFVENGMLFVRSASDPDQVERVDLLLTKADWSALDPTHTPLLERNRRHRGERYNLRARVLGVPGLVRAWSEPRDGGFVWANGPPTSLMRSKLTPILVDDVIRHVMGEEPIAPAVPNTAFITVDGDLDREAVERVGSARQGYVFKTQLGADGDEVWFGDELAEAAWGDLVGRLEREPGSIIAQPFRELARTVLRYADAPDESRRFDVRAVNLVTGGGNACTVLPTPLPIVRMAAPGSRKVNITRGGTRTIGVPARVERVELLAPEATGREDVDRLLQWSREGIPEQPV
jgi:uncharacterized circularly permuted ATP-grasp superfamily protein